MNDILTNRQKILLRYAKEKKVIYLTDAMKFYSSNPQAQLSRLCELGYLRPNPGWAIVQFVYTGKEFENEQ